MSLDPRSSLPYVSEPEVERALDWISLIDAMEIAMIAFSAGEVQQPVRQMIPVPGKSAIMAAMPAVGGGEIGAMGVKVVTVFHDNAGTELPTHQAVILLFDVIDGSPLAALDGRLITEMRTAASTAAVVRKLTPQKPAVATILGNGVQACAHANALRAVREIGELRLWGRSEARAKPVAEYLGAKFVIDGATAVRDSDIIICATSATEPVVRGEWVKNGALVASVGWNGADGRELDDACMRHTVLVESRDAAWNQAGNIRGSACAIHAEVGELFADKAPVPAGATVVYDSVGIAVQDVAAAKLVYDRVHTE